MINVSIRGVLVLLSVVFIGQNSDAAVSEHWGVATDTSGKVVYTERHRVKTKNGEVIQSETVYFDASRKTPIATLVSDYSKSLTLPTYEFKDLRTKYREGLRLVGGRYVIFNQEAGEKENRSVLTNSRSVFSGQGWHYYLVKNLDALAKGDLPLNLILPSELDYYSFKIKGSKSQGDLVEAQLELSNWVLNMFAPSLRLVYDKKQRRLVEFEGISNILDQDGERQDVKIRYSYPADG